MIFTDKTEPFARAAAPDAWQRDDAQSGHEDAAPRPTSSDAGGGRFSGSMRLTGDPEVAAPQERDSLPPRRRVLLVEAQSALSAHVQTCLAPLPDLSLDVAAGGQIGIDLIAQHRFDAVLLGTQIGGTDALDMIASVRRLPLPHCSTPILAILRDADPATRLTLLAEGAQEVIQAPFDADGLQDAVLRCLPSLRVTDEWVDGHALSALLRDLGPEAIVFITRFVAESRATIPTLRAISDHDTLRAEAHALKGTARTFGAFRVSQQALLLEQASRNRAPWADLARLIDAIEQSLAQAERVYAANNLLTPTGG